MRSAAAILLACVALAGCGKSAEEKRIAQREQAAHNIGWQAVFDYPPDTIRQLNQGGFQLTQPAASPYRQAGQPQPVGAAGSGSAGNTINVEIVGRTPSAIDKISYTLTLNDPAGADQGRDRFAQLIGELLDRYAIQGGAPLLDAIRNSRSASTASAGQTSAQMRVDGAPVSLTASANRLDVTFTPPAPKAGAVQTQG